MVTMEQKMQQMADAMQAMAGMLRATTDAMEQLRHQVRLLEKATPAQAAAMNAAIRQRAKKLCADYRMPGQEKAVAAAIRKAVRMQFGASAMRDLPRCDVEAARMQVDMWDDYAVVKAIRKGARA